MAESETFDPSHRKLYTPEQLQLYYERIQLPYRDLQFPSTANTIAGMILLGLLQGHQLASIPFENLALHYSPHHTITLDPQHLFDKIVAQNAGRGGYCMENNGLFGTVLRSIGYNVTSIGARVNQQVQPVASTKGWKGPKYDGWNHMLNIVTINNQKFVVDVGFGSSGPKYPLPLIHDQIRANVGEQEIRFIYDTIPDLTDSSQKLWEYQYRNGPDQPWLRTYCFSEQEFTPKDFEVMNYFTSTHRTSWFTRTIICVKMLMENGEIVGDITLSGNELKKRIKGVSETLFIMKSEEERVELLDKIMGVKLSLAEIEGIKGLVSELL